MNPSVADFKKLLESRMGEISGSCRFEACNWFYGLAAGFGIDVAFVDVSDDRSRIVFKCGLFKHTVRKGES